MGHIAVLMDFLVCERVKRCCDDTRLPAWCGDWRGAIVSMTSMMCVHLGLCSFWWSFDSVWMKKTSAYWEGQTNDRCNAFLRKGKSSIHRIYRILSNFVALCVFVCLPLLFLQAFLPRDLWHHGPGLGREGGLEDHDETARDDFVALAFWIGRHIVAPPFTNFVGGDT